MDKVQKSSYSECYTSYSKAFNIEEEWRLLGCYAVWL
jgi:hypothetical protein